MFEFDVPGRIKCATVTTPTFAASLDDYVDRLGMRIVETGVVPRELAVGWGAPRSAGRRCADLTSTSDSTGFIRLVEGTAVRDYVPRRSLGWAGFELTCQDVAALHDRMAGSGFQVLGAPKPVPGFDNFIPFQVQGRAGEMLYLNQVLESAMDAIDLPIAHAPVDFTFIAVLATRDAEAAARFHIDCLGFEPGETYAIPYRVINDAFGLPAGHLTTMITTRAGRLPASEIDVYPAAAVERPSAVGELPPGNSMVSFITRSLDAIDLPFITPPARQPGALYRGRRSACVRGVAGELIELIEAA